MAKRPFDQINNIDQLITTSERLGLSLIHI